MNKYILKVIASHYPVGICRSFYFKRLHFISVTWLESLLWLLVLWIVWLTTWDLLVQKQLMLPMLFLTVREFLLTIRPCLFKTFGWFETVQNHFDYIIVSCLWNNLSFFFFLGSQTGSDGILLAAETLRGLYPVEAIETVGRICAEVNTCLKFKELSS